MTNYLKLGSLADFVMGQAPSSSDCNVEGRGVPFVKAGEFGDLRPVIREWTTDPLRLAKATDVLICVVGATAGKLNLGADCAIGRSVAAIRPRTNLIDQGFLFHLLRTKIHALRGGSQGSAQGVITSRMLNDIEVPNLRLPDQQRIACILDKADNLRRKRREAIRLANEFLRALFIDMFGDPETNPKSFDKGTIRDLVSSANYGTSEKASEQTGKYPILRMNNITYEGGWDFSSMKYVDLDEASAHKYLTRKGDLLFNRTNSKELVGKTAVYMRDEPMAIAGYLVRVRMNGRGNAHYVSGYLNSAHGKRSLQARAKSIVGMANINAQEMQDIPLLLPPVELQNKFASIVEAVQERLRKQHDFSREAEALHAALCEKFFSQIGEKVTELC